MKKSAKLIGASVAVLTAGALMVPQAFARSSSSPVTITFGTWGGDQENQQLLAIIAKINAQFKGKIVIKDYNVPSNYDQKLNTELAANTAPDIFYVDDGLAQTYSSEGVLMNLSQYIGQNKAKSLVANPANYFPNSLADVKYNGQFYSLPWIAQPVVMYYNPSLFKAAHLPMPSANWTWSTFMHDAKVLTNAKTGVYGFLQANGWPPVEMYIWSYGGSIYNKSMTKAALNTPAALKGLTLMQTMVKEGVVPPLAKLANVNIEDLFLQGKVAMFAGGAADGNYNATGFTAKVQQMPMGTQHASNLWIADLAMNAHTKVPTQDLYKAYTALLNGIDHWKVVPPVRQLAAKLRSIDVPGAPGNRTPADRVAPILNSLKYAQVVPVIKNMSNYWTIMGNDIYTPLLMGTATPQQVAAKAQKDLTANLK